LNSKFVSPREIGRVCTWSGGRELHDSLRGRGSFQERQRDPRLDVRRVDGHRRVPGRQQPIDDQPLIGLDRDP
jgi:hypothetical protein